MRIGITGHSNLAPDAVPLVEDALRAALTEIEHPFIGVTCLARGADQVFARVVLELGGQIEVILPATDYRERKVKPENRDEFESLIEQAVDVTVLPFKTADRTAYAAASDAVLSGVDRVLAVWDGNEPDGTGGTGDTVLSARRRDIPVTVIWPDGARRQPSGD